MKRLWLAGVLGLAVLIFAAVPRSGTPAETENGSEEIMIDTGSKGYVYFPHRQHQKMESITCMVCHDLFPQEAGSISRLKADGILKSRQVMNGLCISCHRKMSAAGKPSGPRSCNACHQK